MDPKILSMLIEKGVLIIKHPLYNKYLVKGDKESYKILRENNIDFIVCEEENILSEEKLKITFENIYNKYKIDKVLFFFDPLLCFIFLVIEQKEVEQEDIVNIIDIITSKTGIIRGIISINGQENIPFSKEKNMKEKNKKEINIEEKAITKDDIINLRILLNTSKSIDELLEKL
jgi:hypothetical protein